MAWPSRRLLHGPRLDRLLLLLPGPPQKLFDLVAQRIGLLPNWPSRRGLRAGGRGWGGARSGRLLAARTGHLFLRFADLIHNPQDKKQQSHQRADNFLDTGDEQW
jgi:hypothetical protein